MKKKLLVLTLIMTLICAFSLTSCGGSEETADTSGPSYVEDGKLHMATNAAFPPYEMTTDDGGYEGIDVEIAAAIAEKLGVELVVDDMDFTSILTAVQGGKADMAMAGLTVTEERKQNVDFTDTYAQGVQSIIVKEGSDIKTVDDLEGKKIATQEGTTGWIYCSDDYGDENVLALPKGADAVTALKNGQADCVVIDNNPAKAFVENNEGLVILDTAYAVEDYAIAVSKDNPDLCEAINNALKELIEDGTVQSIIDK